MNHTLILNISHINFEIIAASERNLLRIGSLFIKLPKINAENFLL